MKKVRREMKKAPFLFILFLSTLFILSTSRANSPKLDLMQKSCVHASYPDICLRTLSSYGGGATTPRGLAQVAVRVSLAHVRRASDFLSQIRGSGGGSGRREQGALDDCVEQMGDFVDELSKTLAALQHLRRDSDFRWQMNNAETWVSAALTNEDTCLDGFREIEAGIRSEKKLETRVIGP